MACKDPIAMNPIIISKLNCHNSKPSKIRVFAVAAGAAMILMAGATSSCSTARGFGQDVEKTGDKIQDAAAR
jgi:predicted small secreted protein